MRLYLTLAALIVVGTFCVLSGLAIVGVYACRGCGLIFYQEYKVEHAPAGTQTVFVGDSALGYALDAQSFSKLQGAGAMNLALTGWDAGLPAAYALLVRALNSMHPKNVVLMLTPQDYARSIAQLDYLPIRGFIKVSRNDPAILLSIGPQISSYVARVVVEDAFDQTYVDDGLQFVRHPPRRDGANPCAPCIPWDYAPPLPGTIDTNSAPEVWPLPVPQDYRAFFEKMAALCQQAELNCLYLHGTVHHKAAERNRAFIEQLSDLITTAGITVANPMPIEISDSEIGNTINHIRPEYRQLYTRKIYDMIAPLLR